MIVRLSSENTKKKNSSSLRDRWHHRRSPSGIRRDDTPLSATLVNTKRAPVRREGREERGGCAR
eukprot:2023900-Prymnesium_polylepis.1